MKKICSLGLIALTFMAFQACSNGGSNSSKDTADSINKANEPLSRDATQLMEDAATINMLEIQMGKLAQQQATLDRVKNYASMLITDHKNLNSQLRMLAQNKNVALPDSLDQKHQDDIADLKKKNGSNFDESYIDDMVKGHKNAIDKFQDAQNNISDADVKAYITQGLPILKKHLDSAQAIQDYIKGRNQ